MERRRGKKKQLKWRILGSIALILAVSMTISSLAGYWYFERIVREQKISDERSRLIQVSGQLTFLAEDIRQFARSILIDAELQELLEEDVAGSAYRKQRRNNKVSARLIFYGSLRGYIKDMIISILSGGCKATIPRIRLISMKNWRGGKLPVLPGRRAALFPNHTAKAAGS